MIAPNEPIRLTRSIASGLRSRLYRSTLRSSSLEAAEAATDNPDYLRISSDSPDRKDPDYLPPFRDRFFRVRVDRIRRAGEYMLRSPPLSLIRATTERSDKYLITDTEPGSTSIR